MRVALLSHAMGVRSTWSKTEMLRKRVDLTTVIPARWDDYVVDDRGADPTGLVRLPCGLAGRNHFFWYKGIGRLFSQRTFDLVHIDEEPQSLVTSQVAAQARNRRVPYIIFSWQNIFKKYPPPFNMMERWVLRGAAGIICGNADSADVFRRKGFRGHIALIPQFGVDDALFTVRGRKSGDGVLRLVYAGRIVPEKGLDTVLRAMPDQPWIELHVIGSGPSQAELVRHARELGVAERVKFLGPMSSVDVPLRVADFDALVLPSLTRRNWKEQFGRVLVEAMAVGTPVVGSSSGEIPNVIGDAGLVFHEGDSGDLRRALGEMRAIETRSRLAVAGRKRALRFTQSAVVESTLSFYSTVLSAQQPL